MQVDVHDNGIGIVPEVHDRIFERFCEKIRSCW